MVHRFAFITALAAVFAQASSLTGTSFPHQLVSSKEQDQPTLATICKANLTGPIESTQCDYETVESINNDLYDNLHALVDEPFFKYVKLDLYRDCPFWEDNGFCALRDCAVTTVDEKEIPVKWRAASLGELNRPGVDQLRNTFPGCYYRDSDFCVLDDDEDSHGEYIDLSLNPERFTGYAGPAAHNVWRAIYEENCFGLSEETFKSIPDPVSSISPAGLGSPMQQLAQKVAEEEVCLEKKVYYRIISGLHASINTHVCYEMMNQKTGEWGPDLQCFIDKVASHPERLQHVYFNTVLLLRAVSRVGRYLSAYDMRVSDERADDAGKSLLGSVINIANRAGAFDEKILFNGDDAKFLKEEFKHHFRNVTRIMDCVGCSKCRLWGKVQTSGVGTALKILFELDEKALDPAVNPNLLQRSEIVSLVNTLHRFSESIRAVDTFRKMWHEKNDPSSKSSAKDTSQQENEGRTYVTPSNTGDTHPPMDSPRSTSPLPLSEAVTKQLHVLWKACQRSTVACVDLVERAVSTFVSLFKLSGKDETPRPDL